MVPQLLGRGFQKAKKNSQKVVTRMQDLAHEFLKNFSGVIATDPHSGRRRPPPASNTRPGVRTQTLVPLNFSAVVDNKTTACYPRLSSLPIDDFHYISACKKRPKEFQRDARSAIAERRRCSVRYSFHQKWKTGTGRQYFKHIIGLFSTTVI